MASILTNTSAMVALQNLRTINADLVGTQNEIATGKKVATAKDNSAIWAVSKVIESDVNSFQAISDSLNLGDSTVAVAREASETVTDLLTELRGNIVAAQEENVDRSKIQADIDTQISQIQSIVSAASFNGLSLVEGTADVSILSSLQRDSNGNVSSSSISIARNDLTTNAGSVGTNAAANEANAVITETATAVASAGNGIDLDLGGTWADGNTVSFNVGSFTIDYTATTAGGLTNAAVGDDLAGLVNALGIEGVEATYASDTLTITSTRAFDTLTVDNLTVGGGGGTVAIDTASSDSLLAGATTTAATTRQRAEEIVFSGTSILAEGDGYGVTIGGATYNYVAGPNETFEDVARGLKIAIDGAGVTGISTQVNVNSDGTTSLFIDNDGTGSASLALARNASEGGTAAGGLFGLQDIDVTTNQGASAALSNIDTFINTSIDAAASFGSDQSRIDLQAGFITKLTDSLKQGIGSLVDADLEATSARLQALQVQQQLGIQSLSIANQAPQSILSLFR